VLDPFLAAADLMGEGRVDLNVVTTRFFARFILFIYLCVLYVLLCDYFLCVYFWLGLVEFGIRGVF
jgi:hypothetical protein